MIADLAPDATFYREVPHDLIDLRQNLAEGMPFRSLAASRWTFFWQFLLKEFDVKPRGIMHVGAHAGQELLPYVLAGFERLFFVEASPVTYQRLARNADGVQAMLARLDSFMGSGERPRIGTMCVAVSDRVGSTVLYELHQSALSSLYEPDARSFQVQGRYLREMLPRWKRPFAGSMMRRATRVTERVEVKTTTLDDLGLSLPHGWEIHDFNVLRLNIQGSELAALRGGSQVLAAMDIVSLETNLASRYAVDREPTLADLDDLMASYGMHRVMALRWGPIGNLTYLRRASAMPVVANEPATATDTTALDLGETRGHCPPPKGS